MNENTLQELKSEVDKIRTSAIVSAWERLLIIGLLLYLIFR